MKLSRGELKSAIIGMVMGDASLGSKCKGRKNGTLQMSHCAKQLGYLEWKKEAILDQIVNSKITRNDKVTKDRVYEHYHLTTWMHPLFTRLYNRFYHFGHKCLDEYLVKMITPLALAILYMDDGTFSKAGGRNESFFLCVQSFDFANQMLLKKSLKIKFGLDWNIVKAQRSVKGHRLYRMRLYGRHNDDFIKIIKPYVDLIPCMHYKLSSYASTSKDVDIVRPS